MKSQRSIVFLIAWLIFYPFIAMESQDAGRERSIFLPANDGHYRVVRDYIEDIPDSSYVHAPEEVYEAFRDIKFAIRIHWGVYSMWNVEASWPFLDWPSEKKQEYNQLYKTFNPVNFNAQEWMDFFKRSGIQAFAFTAKHHDGFSMFHTRTKVVQRVNYLHPEQPIERCELHYSMEETPFKRDIVGELCDAARKNGIKIDLYFSHPDWYDADFRPYNYHPLATPSIQSNPNDYGNNYSNNRKTVLTTERTPEETGRLIARHREQLHELLTRYGPIDMICLDQWMGRDIWPQMRETVKMMRQWSPNTLFRARGIGNYGDYYQPEQFIPGAMQATEMPWMSICLLGNQFAYDPDSSHYKGTQWIIHHLIECVAKGGSFMVCIGPDHTGLFHPEAIRQIEAVGQWLAVNGAGIYETRPYHVWQEGDVCFTRSKDNKTVYALTEKWPGQAMVIKSVKPVTDSQVYLLGYPEPLQWEYTEEGIKIQIPQSLQAPGNRPCEYAWLFRFEKTISIQVKYGL